MTTVRDISFPLELKPPFRHVRGYGYEARLPFCMESKGNISGQSMRSPLVLCENGTPLTVRHSQSIGIWYCGGGRYNHGGTSLFFATYDNSDPNANGRRYTVRLSAPSSPHALALPQRLHVVLSCSCNLWCRICREKPFTGSSMDMRVFDKIAEECFPHTSELRLDSGGELLLNSDLAAILRKVTFHGMPFFTSSNGMLLTREKALLLAESSLHHIQISLDSPVKETLEWIRRGAQFERIIQGIRNLVQARRDVGRPFLITFHAAVMRENVGHMPDLVRLAHGLGVEGVTACHLYTHACMNVDSSCFWNPAEYDKNLALSIETARSLDSFFYGPSPFAAEIMPDDGVRGFCDYPEYGTYINPDGSVMPCCVAPTTKLGNVAVQSFAEIWNGAAYRDLRDTYRTDTPSLPRCKDCLIRKDTSQSYQSYFAPAHWQTVRERIAELGVKA